MVVGTLASGNGLRNLGLPAARCAKIYKTLGTALRCATQIQKYNAFKLICTMHNHVKHNNNSDGSPSQLLVKCQTELNLTCYCQCSQLGDGFSKSYSWLINTVIPQFIKWSNETQKDIGNHSICNESLALVSKSRYYQKYNELKLKYGKEMVKIWPECTDPSKFVYEDVAIATYLLLLWEDEQGSETKKQTFVDFGCGNGLLVYILTKEGHNGLGIDIRKRQIWDMYPSGIKLEERLITPSELSLHAEADWIIGNHSDELTPWIPVIASKSSYKCNFFVLPCCAFNFDGTKYQRKNSNKTQYTEYLEYIKQLSEECGFKTYIDRLKIPSTKRICIVSKGRTYKIDEYQDYCEKIQNIITQDSTPCPEENNSLWVQGFKPRETVERVRNCTQIDKNLIDSIVSIITNYLLQECCLEPDGKWSIGKVVDIHVLVQLIPPEQLKLLKSECGGLQTLMKNNHHIFQVQQGKVQLRYPKSIDEVSTNSKKNLNKVYKIKLQEKPCWFYNNHPQGCPLKDDKCSFLHVKR
ncbi:hypothetical protein O3G_MSEX005446 [Manduca sexta]|uniref:tRNA (uracil-O(2)-)-methyltransferase n=1 Tax=Manduca sexta TaxID=7130 RepID=A0A922CJH9_MANSE|nr:hypothetical protein O3G_MSEX005446 [Manduca sexta]